MFTGIITDIGEVLGVTDKGPDRSFTLRTGFDMRDIELGASIACDGACMTVVQKGKDWFAIDVSAESLRRTTLGRWQIGARVNLERSLRIGDELGGHIVSGHVDGTAELKAKKQMGECFIYQFMAANKLMHFIAEKGSVTLNGVSLTVNDLTDNSFHVNVLEYTYHHTNFGQLEVGDSVNLEIDVIARYTARLLETK